MEAAFEAAGWVAVDRTRQDAIIHAVLASMGKQTYTEMPMSELYLYGRVQDYGFARAQPIDVMTSRHHLRIWQAPFEISATPVWVGAATHDIGFEQDQRDGSITHKIDPNVDGERDFLGKTFKASGATDITYMRPRNAISHATTATGGRFHSDGRVLILHLGPHTEGASPRQKSPSPHQHASGTMDVEDRAHVLGLLHMDHHLRQFGE